MLRIVAFSLTAMVLAAPALAQTTLTLSSWVPPTQILHRELVLPWAAAVEAAS